MRINRTRSTLLMAAMAVLLLAGVSAACPMCKDSIPNSDAQQAGGLPVGFNNSVYFILVGFLTVLCSTIVFIIKAVRNTQARPGFAVIPREPTPRRPMQH